MLLLIKANSTHYPEVRCASVLVKGTLSKMEDQVDFLADRFFAPADKPGQTHH